MIEFAVCDNDIAFANTLAQKINHILVGISDNYDYYIHKFYSSDQVLSFIENHPINILFLDIDMPNKNGFCVAETLQNKSLDTIIIFVSAYDKFVYESFKFTPFCFLRKEHIGAELKSTLNKVLEKFFENNVTIQFNTVDGIINIRAKDIVYIESIKNYYLVHCKSDTIYKCRGTLTSIETELNLHSFVRVHQAYIVNLQNVMSVHANRKIIMYPNFTLFASLRKWASFNEAYMEFSRRRIVF